MGYLTKRSSLVLIIHYRVGTSILSTLGLPELVVFVSFRRVLFFNADVKSVLQQSKKDYNHLAISLARNKTFYKSIRDKYEHVIAEASIIF